VKQISTPSLEAIMDNNSPQPIRQQTNVVQSEAPQKMYRSANQPPSNQSFSFAVGEAKICIDYANPVHNTFREIHLIKWITVLEKALGYLQ
jgi:hypothetical protein